LEGSGGKQWFTAAELAEFKLPGLAKVKRKINEKAAADRWALRTDDRGAPLARKRIGRGGGLEYHASLLPASARLELVKRGLAGEATVAADPPSEVGALWAWYESQSEATKAEAAKASGDRRGRRGARARQSDTVSSGGLRRRE
jgi:putative transposase